MKNIIILTLLSTFLVACNGSKGGGGSSGGSPAPVSVPTLSYGSTTLNFTANQNKSFNPIVTGCSNSTCEYSLISGTLPPGLFLSTATGVIYGYPNSVQTANVVVRVTNSAGYANVNLLVAVSNAPVGGGGTTAPKNFYYMPNPLSLTINQVPMNFPLSPSIENCDGGCTFSVQGSNPLPSGINLNVSSGVLSGLPTQETINRTVVIRATKGSVYVDSAPLTFNVRHAPPAGLLIQNLASGNLYQVGQSISPISLNYSSPSGSVTSMVLDKDLPDGLSLQLTGSYQWKIVGTPSVAKAIESYKLTACGPTAPCQELNFLLGTGHAPTTLSYNITGRDECVMDGDIPSCTFYKQQVFPSIDPVFDGTDVMFQITSGWEGPFTQAEPLPSGMQFSAVTGKISTPGVGAWETTAPCTLGGAGTCLYTVRAYNGLGSITTQIKIKVGETSAVLGNFNYGASNFVFRTLSVIPTMEVLWDNGNLPTCHGQEALCYTVSPALPDGLTMSQLNGRIQGSLNLDSIQAPTEYTITAHDPERGTRETVITIEVKERLPVFTYNNVNLVLAKGQAITGAYLKQTEDLCGWGAIRIDSFSITPALPDGLSLNTGAYTCAVQAPELNGGAINGSPNIILEETTYTITACNSGGCHSQEITIEVPPGAIKVVSGQSHSCAIVKEQFNDPFGKVMCWGANDKGQLGHTSTESCSTDMGLIPCSKKAKLVQLGGSALSDVVELTAGANHTCAIKYVANPNENAQGTAYCWGDNSNGQLGSGFAGASTHIPQMIQRVIPANENKGSLGGYTNNANLNSPLMEQVMLISAGKDRTCIGAEYISIGFNVEADDDPPFELYPVIGQVYCSNSVSKKMERIKDLDDTISLSQFNDNNIFVAQELGVGDDFVCAKSMSVGYVTENGETWVDLINSQNIKCFGLNDRGQLGNGSTVDSAFPVFVKYNGSIIEGADRLVVGANHSCYYSENYVRCWGDNSLGQLGLGTIGGYEETAQNVLASGGGNFATTIGDVGLTANSTFISKIFGTGEDADYLLHMTGQHIIPLAPYVGDEVANPINILSASGVNLRSFEVPNGSAAEKSACFLPFGGGIFCYGENEAGQLGNDSTTDSVYPVRVKFQF